ncbi:MAG: tRNA pseudouridine(38-40) synthase TruA [Lachnospiraceae bacterium]|nr:tRNA pseudouridine(38-40) synthase TruA [Lachnospiraceae bacterium]
MGKNDTDIIFSKRIMLRVAYDGTDFVGWQVQPRKRTVEGELNKALSELTGEDIIVIGASRTDSGVHAKGNVAVFDTFSTIPGEKFMYAVNTLLPEDVSVVESREVPNDFHPRHCDSIKTYEYGIYISNVSNPLKNRYYLRCPYELNVEKMDEAAKYLVGEHDFKSFCCVRTQAETTVRKIISADVFKENEDEIIIRVSGAGFLYNMVRIIAGSLMEVGSGKYEPIHIKDVLESTDRTVAGPTAEPQGLTLVGIEFADL